MSRQLVQSDSADKWAWDMYAISAAMAGAADEAALAYERVDGSAEPDD